MKLLILLAVAIAGVIAAYCFMGPFSFGLLVAFIWFDTKLDILKKEKENK